MDTRGQRYEVDRRGVGESDVIDKMEWGVLMQVPGSGGGDYPRTCVEDIYAS